MQGSGLKFFFLAPLQGESLGFKVYGFGGLGLYII